MGIELSATLHSYQPFRDMRNVIFVPLSKRNSGLPDRELIPHPDGKPADDWNIKFITPECYEPLAKGGVFENLTTNFGPTLLNDLQFRAHGVYNRIVEAEKRSRDKFDGHSCFIGQASPYHAIVPLEKTEDKITHIKWSLGEYEKHFKNKPEGIWLPETAVCEETLALLADEGVKFVILAPKQAKEFKPVGWGDSAWQDAGWDGANINPGEPYKVSFADEKFQDKNISVFFYDGPFSHNIGYPDDGNKWMYDSSENFLHRWLSAKGDYKHFGVDTETFGHHQKGKDALLVGAVNLINERPQDWRGAKFTNYGKFLAEHPPTKEVKIHNNSSWSCDVELNRWGQRVTEVRSDGQFSWFNDKHSFYGTDNPYWRVEMRHAFENLKDKIDRVYDKYAGKHLKDPQAALHDYISVVSNSKSFYDFFDVNKTHNGDPDAAYELLEMQKFKLMMVTSCGWFHDSPQRIEPFGNFLCANTAIRIAEKYMPNEKIEEAFLKRLSHGMMWAYNRAKETNTSFLQRANSQIANAA